MRLGIFSMRWVTASPGSVSGSGDSCWQISVNISKTVQDRDNYVYNGRLIGNRIWPIKWQQRQWPWMTWKVIHWLQAFSNAICQTFMQHFTRFRLTACSRSICVSGASCMDRETTGKRIFYAGNTSRSRISSPDELLLYKVTAIYRVAHKKRSELSHGIMQRVIKINKNSSWR